MKRLISMILLLSSCMAFAAGVPVGIAPLPMMQFNQGGIPCSGCKLFLYAAGTTTKQLGYTDSTGTVVQTDPVILDVNGQAQIWLQGGLSYKYTLSPSTDTDPPTNPYWTIDNVSNSNSISTKALIFTVN